MKKFLRKLIREGLPNLFNSFIFLIWIFSVCCFTTFKLIEYDISPQFDNGFIMWMLAVLGTIFMSALTLFLIPAVLSRIGEIMGKKIESFNKWLDKDD